MEIGEWLKTKEEALFENLAVLVAIPSVAERENTEVPGVPFGKACRKALEQMEAFGKREGFETEDLDGYCLSLSVGSGKIRIGIWNHLDVVPAGDGWQYPPFVCTEKNGYLIGRGVQDNKGPALAVFYALM